MAGKICSCHLKTLKLKSVEEGLSFFPARMTGRTGFFDFSFFPGKFL